MAAAFYAGLSAVITVNIDTISTLSNVTYWFCDAFLSPFQKEKSIYFMFPR